MATGRLGAIDLVSNIMTTLYSVPANTLSTLNLNICNRNATQISVRIAIIPGPVSSLTNADYIEYDTVISGQNVLKRSGIILQAGYTLAIRSDSIGVNAMCWGFEDSTI